ncbi:uncharacterized protein [Triticum aestivum]|uniref:uncharacterized protein isoform X2 n=1 Tax=Triticum aestivum TaxID=4565 RepID=UPI001D00D7F0|nr:uncharacterized protein LOC123061795 isoform X2 [Triticum aestivum]
MPRFTCFLMSNYFLLLLYSTSSLKAYTFLCCCYIHEFDRRRDWRHTVGRTVEQNSASINRHGVRKWKVVPAATVHWFKSDIELTMDVELVDTMDNKPMKLQKSRFGYVLDVTNCMTCRYLASLVCSVFSHPPPSHKVIVGRERASGALPTGCRPFTILLIWTHHLLRSKILSFQV